MEGMGRYSGSNVGWERKRSRMRDEVGNVDMWVCNGRTLNLSGPLFCYAARSGEPMSGSDVSFELSSLQVT